MKLIDIYYKYRPVIKENKITCEIAEDIAYALTESAHWRYVQSISHLKMRFRLWGINPDFDTEKPTASKVISCRINQNIITIRIESEMIYDCSFELKEFALWYVRICKGINWNDFIIDKILTYIYDRFIKEFPEYRLKLKKKDIYNLDVSYEYRLTHLFTFLLEAKAKKRKKVAKLFEAHIDEKTQKDIEEIYDWQIKKLDYFIKQREHLISLGYANF